MKILKKAKQHNVELNKGYYNSDDILKMLQENKIFFIDDDNNYECSNDTNVMLKWLDENIIFRIDTSDLKEIKVALDDEGYYTTIAIGNDDNIYYVTL